ncbi:MAG: ABC transporter ATP-binding protein [Actinomycetota bacterium]
MSVLEVEGVSIGFGGVQALGNVNINIDEWEIVGLIGPNGAGKTTLFSCITGFYAQDRGAIRFKGQDVTRLPPHKRAGLGIGRTFQQVGLVRSMSVLENLLLAQHREVDYGDVAGMVGLPETFGTEAELRTRAMRVLDFMGLDHLAESSLSGLPYGTLKAIEVAAVLATDPELLLLDEPAAGMGPEEAHSFGDRVKEMRRELGITVVMIDHHVPLVVSVSDYMYCLDFGQVLTHGKPEYVRNHPEVLEAYLGEEAKNGQRRKGKSKPRSKPKPKRRR